MVTEVEIAVKCGYTGSDLFTIMNTFGHLFRVTTFGESHGIAVGVVVDGCPPGLRLSLSDFDQDLGRRRTAQSSLVSSRKEKDEIEILSGIFEGHTLGTPIAILVRNINARSEDYEKFKDLYRPSHADFTYDMKYGRRDFRGGGRASARETVARVMAGVIAKKILKEACGMEILAYVRQVGKIVARLDPEKVTFKQVESNIVRCPDAKTAEKMVAHIKAIQKKGDSVGGVVECVVKNVPVGLGDPIFDKLKATLAHAMMSIPATMGFEVGSGFGSLDMLGSEHNDQFILRPPSPLPLRPPWRSGRTSARGGKVVATKTNHSGGIQGGISNGMPIVFRTVFKPVSTIFQDQQTVTKDLKKHTLKMYGRHDPCVVPRAVVIVEAMAAIVMADHWLRQKNMLHG